MNTMESHIIPNDSSYDEKPNDSSYDEKPNDSLHDEKPTKVEEIHNFEDLPLKENLLRGIYAYGFESPSPIQRKAIKPITECRDVVAQAQSGTGKTGTFSIGTLQRIDESLKACQAIIIAPTRELAQQIDFVISSIGSHMKDLETVLCVGGTDINEAKSGLRKGAQIVIGTPGRIINMIKRKFMSTRDMKLIVMDEADEMLSNSFIPQIKFIIESLPEETQICLFSATMPREALKSTRHFLRNPVSVLVKKDQLTLEGIRQFLVNVNEEQWKFETFCDLYETISITQSIVYVNSKDKADWLYESIKEKGFTASLMHGKMSPLDRTRVMNEFRKGSSRILISTDLLARGIDVQQVSIVVNYDVPFSKDNYIHRIGRSGRFGRKGVAINFTTHRELRLLRDIERFYNTQIDDLPEPSEIQDLL